MTIILHITARQQWQSAQAAGAYKANSLDIEGFIHCSSAEQVVRVANSFYRGQTDLALLCIETEQLQSLLKWESPLPANDPHSGELFPHVYGEINVEAVVKVVDFPPNADGTFTLPAL
jgi:uncharacterized protein (DUF952 family)